MLPVLATSKFKYFKDRLGISKINNGISGFLEEVAGSLASYSDFNIFYFPITLRSRNALLQSLLA